jgi:non-specific serine/threonine protein kinase
LQAAWNAGHALTQAEAVAEALAAGSMDRAPAPRARTDRRHERLTSRELEVARLLALGQTDRQIADALTISVRTAGVHVQHVLGKLGVRSRWQVAERIAAPEPTA